MSGIAGFCTFTHRLSEGANEHTRVLADMGDALKKRGGGAHGEWLGMHCGLSAVYRNNAAYGVMPYTFTTEEGTAAAVFDGEIYNRDSLWASLPRAGYERAEGGDAALVLLGFIEFGVDFVKRLNGVFAFAIWRGGVLYLFRDHAGVKPLFYTQLNGTFLFASEMKGLFAYPGVTARLDARGLTELLAVGPAREERSGVFKDIYAVPPGYFCSIGEAWKAWNGTETIRVNALSYWDLPDAVHPDDEAETVARVRTLMMEAITGQTECNDQICAFLSGGVDSSIVTAVAAEQFKNAGKRLRSFSFDFIDSGRHFAANAYQPDLDRPWVEKMVDFARTEHHFLECGPEALAGLLGDAVTARDLPGMADIDGSLLYFSSRLPAGSVALTGECADE